MAMTFHALGHRPGRAIPSSPTGTTRNRGAGRASPQPLPCPPVSEQIILTLHRLVKRYPPDKVVLDGITLSFLHGAKIGVLGVNGSGKIRHSCTSLPASTRSTKARSNVGRVT